MPNPGLTHITTVPESLGFFRGQLDYMKDRGFVVRAITSPGQDMQRFATEYAISITAVAMDRRITPRADVVAVRTMRRLLRQHRPAIVHAHTPKGGLLGLMAATSAATPVRIYHMRGLPFVSATGWKRRLLRHTERLSCHLAHQVFCVSDSLRSLALKEKLCHPAKIKVLGAGSGNGVDAAGRFNPDTVGPDARRDVRARLGLASDALVIAFVGRIVRDKGVIELVTAWGSIREANPNAHVLLIGPWESKDPIARNTEHAIRLDPRIHVIGMAPDMPRLYAAADLVVLPTYREGFPNVLLEAAAMRLPVVATTVPGCVDAVEDSETGILVQPRQAEALTLAIQTYLSDPDLRRRHGEAARERVLAHFRPEAIWRALHQDYVRLLERAGLSVDRVAGAPARIWG